MDKDKLLVYVIDTVVAVLLAILIFQPVADYCYKKTEEYQKAIQIVSDEDLFKQALNTNFGNAFVEGHMQALDPISDKHIKGQYLYLVKDKQHYTEHTRTVRHSNGKTTWYTTKRYYTWDTVDYKKLKSKKVSFLGQTFDTSKFNFSEYTVSKTVSLDYNDRIVFSGIKSECDCTIYTELADGNIGDDTDVNYCTLEEMYDTYINFYKGTYFIYWFIVIVLLIISWCVIYIVTTSIE